MKNKIDYKYLNLDEKKFYPNRESLYFHFKNQIYIEKVISNYKFKQMLWVISKKKFSELKAITICRELTGVI